MATLKTNTLTGTSTAGSIAVTGEGNSTTTNLQQGLAKHWVNYDSSDQATRGSFNQASLTDNAAGDYTSSYTSNLSGAEDKCISTNVWNTSDDASNINAGSTRGGANADQAGDTAQSTSSINWMSYFGSSADANAGNADFDGNYCMTHGDLA
jgi:hypothetical protein|tara:strand:+ start:131 stop:586 length:456 start_codon:yes stop_codon:yes gene_type:complete